MQSPEKEYIKKIKQLVDNGLSMAEAFLKVFENHELNSHEHIINIILKHYSIQDLQIGSDYFFIDGSRLNIDINYDCMVATKAVNINNQAGI